MIKIGIDYYPEHWERSLWEEDVERMQALGVHVVRLAEFAWSRMEPRDGEFDFGWLDDAIEVLSRHGMKVILGTPTNSAPRWLYHEHPDTIRWGKDGKPTGLGIRGHRCTYSPTYRKYAGRIVEEMAKRYAGKPEVAGWQIDNELDSNHCACPACRQGFRDFLRKKYGTLDALNRAWGTDVWSGEYSDWDQIETLTAPDCLPDWYNPAWLLDYERFAVWCTADYIAAQCDIIRRYDPDAVITTNSCFPADMPDFHQQSVSLTVAGYDNYPPLRLSADPDALESNAFALDFVRGFKRKNFWILEQLGGPMGCWGPISPAMKPGMLEGYALQAVSHGADLLSFFRWRTSRTGAEMFCHGLLDHSNADNRRLRELDTLCRRLERLPELGEVHSECAMLYSAEQEFSFKNQRQSEGFDYWTQLRLFHGACMELGVNLDVVHEDTPLDSYKVVIVPCHFVVNPGLAGRLEAFAAAGGTVVLTNRSGVKDKNGNCIVGDALPTVFRKLCGCHVTEYDPIGPVEQRISTARGGSYRITSWCDLLALDTAAPWARYQGRFYAGVPAVTCNQFGKGQAYYIGTVGEKSFYRTLLLEIFRDQQLEVLDTLPRGVESTVRSSKGGRYRFFFNNTMHSQRILLNGERVQMSPFEMKIRAGRGAWM